MKSEDIQILDQEVFVYYISELVYIKPLSCENLSINVQLISASSANAKEILTPREMI